MMSGEEWERALAWAEYRRQQAARPLGQKIREAVWEATWGSLVAFGWLFWQWLRVALVFGAIAAVGAFASAHLPQGTVTDPAPYEYDGGACNRMDDTGCD